MSVLIKGMEMPKNCGECPMICEDDLCHITKGGRTINERPPHCPLIEVPPHGRLIDADAPIPLVDTHGKNIEVTVSHIIENNLGIVNAIIEAEEGV